MRPLLIIVATPIGNLDDISARAIKTLRAADAILAEDTRVSRKLLAHFAINTPLHAFHDHNEHAATEKWLAELRGGKTLALISDAGTPLINDPGYTLVAAAHAAGVSVRVVPGACAPLAALSASGLPTDRFAYEGFLPASGSARRARLQALAADTRTLIFLEAPHRLLESLQDMSEIFSAARRATLARELTKIHETLMQDTLAGLLARVQADANQQRGEIVLCVAGAAETGADDPLAGLPAARVLKSYLPASKAAAAAAKISGGDRDAIYAALNRDPTTR